MSINQPLSRLENFININLPEVLAKDTASSLGDRSKYIGASDIGSSCLRKAYLSKQQKVEHSIAQHIVFERGHIAEELVKKMIKGTPVQEQVEAVGRTSNGFPIKAHIDFVVDFGRECVVIEAKSTSVEVDEPYESWVLQTQLQMGLLKKQCDSHGKKIRGYIIAINVNTGWYKTFEVQPNQVLLNLAMSKANQLAESLVSKQCPDGEEQLYCSKCPFKGDCDAITKGAVEQLPDDVKMIVEKIKSLSSVEKEIKSLKSQLKDFMEATEKKRVKSNDFTVSLVNVKGKKTVDTKLLQAEMPDIYRQYETESNGYSFIKIV